MDVSPLIIEWFDLDSKSEYAFLIFGANRLDILDIRVKEAPVLYTTMNLDYNRISSIKFT